MRLYSEVVAGCIEVAARIEVAGELVQDLEVLDSRVEALAVG
jgi:hypothetical protein